MAQLENIESIEKRLWNAADTLRANSNYASNEYFMPVMGLIFLRHAYNRYLLVRNEIERNLPTRGGKTRALTKADFSQKSAIFLQPQARFDNLVALTDSDDRAKALARERAAWKMQKKTNGALKTAVERLATMAETSRDLVRQADLLYKLASRLIEEGSNGYNAKENGLRSGREFTRSRKAADTARQMAVEQLKQVRYFWKQTNWLIERFPEGRLRDVEGLVKLVDRKEIEQNDWSLTPGRYVGVAPEEADEGFDFEEALRDIHVELEGLNAVAMELGAKIKRNFEGLGI